MVRRLLFAALAGLAACSVPEEPLPPGDARIVVHAILDPSRGIQVVDFRTTDGSPLKSEDLDSAIVILRLPDGTALTAKQDTEPADPYDYRNPVSATYRFDLQAAGVQLLPGAKYDLRITTRSGDTITGSTTIPAANPSPVPGPASFSRSRDTLRLSWDAVTGARAYELQVWRTFTQYYNGRYLTYSAFVKDSVNLAGTARSAQDDEVFMPTSQAAVYLFAVDENYYEYYRSVGDPYVGAAPSRLQGALGLFGSVVPIVRRDLAIH
jgi:hypothetical protein